MYKKDLEGFAKIALDSLQIDDKVFTRNEFMKQCYAAVFDSELLSSNWNNISWIEMDTAAILPCAKERIVKWMNVFRLRRFGIKKRDNENNPWIVYLNFIETKKGFRFYGCTYFGDRRKCCP